MYYIYLLQNIINNKIYVGQTNNLIKRKREHKSRSKYKNTPLYASIRKYGFINFNMIEIEKFDNQAEIDEAEEFWIQFFQSRNREYGYNLTIGGTVNRGFKHTQQFKTNKSIQMKKHFIKHPAYNRKFNNEQINEIRNLFITQQESFRQLARTFNTNHKIIEQIIMNKTYFNINYTPDIDLINQIKENNKKKRYSIKIKDEHNNIFNSIDEASKYYSVSGDTIKWHLVHTCTRSKNNLPKFFYIS